MSDRALAAVQQIQIETIGDYSRALVGRHGELQQLWTQTAALAAQGKLTSADRRRWNELYIRHVARQVQLAEYLKLAGQPRLEPKAIGCFAGEPGCPVTTNDIQTSLASLPPLATEQGAGENIQEAGVGFVIGVLFAILAGTLLVASLGARIAGPDVLAVFVADHTAIEQYRLQLADARARGEDAPEPPRQPRSWLWLFGLGTAATVLVIGWWAFKNPARAEALVERGRGAVTRARTKLLPSRS